jgi:hypothetical protein
METAISALAVAASPGCHPAYRSFPRARKSSANTTYEIRFAKNENVNIRSLPASGG